MYDASLVKTIALDFDGVLCETHIPWLEAYNQATGESVTTEDITDYNMAQFVNDPATLWASRTPDVYAKASPDFHAHWFHIILLFQVMGHKVVVLTKERNPDLISAKRQWLDRWFLHLPQRLELITVDSECKSTVGVDYLVDDCPDNILPFGDRAILYQRQWNDQFVDDRPIDSPIYFAAVPQGILHWLLVEHQLPLVSNSPAEATATKHLIYTGIIPVIDRPEHYIYPGHYSKFHPTMAIEPCAKCDKPLENIEL